mmetsp:Transcript_32464/g.63930  ORF Transcript_32464/g.63930 Transcript_32464/m.63930 type:complete len:80 (+) Transcript_32464:772-1011(+)
MQQLMQAWAQGLFRAVDAPFDVVAAPICWDLCNAALFVFFALPWATSIGCRLTREVQCSAGAETRITVDPIHVLVSRKK